MSKNAAHGSRTLAALSTEKRVRLEANIDTNPDTSALKLAKNLAGKYGLDYADLLGIISRRRRGLPSAAGALPR